MQNITHSPSTPQPLPVKPPDAVEVGSSPVQPVTPATASTQTIPAAVPTMQQPQALAHDANYHLQRAQNTALPWSERINAVISIPGTDKKNLQISILKGIYAGTENLAVKQAAASAVDIIDHVEGQAMLRAFHNRSTY